MHKSKITAIEAIEILDSRGFPTVQTTIFTEAGVCGTAAVPSGASTGELEAVELRDKDPKRYHGKGVLRAIEHVKGPLFSLIKGESVFEQTLLDLKMCDADGTKNKSKWGANAILSVSLAIAKAAANTMQTPLYRYLGGQTAHLLPCPLFNILNGGAHADNHLEFQEFMIRPHAAPSFAEAVRWGSQVYHELKRVLKEKNLSSAVGDEGGFAPLLSSNEEALHLIMEAIARCGFRPGHDISIALDCAASQFYDKKSKTYSKRPWQEQVGYLQSLCQQFPIDSIEDGMAEDDWDGWKFLNEKLGNHIQLVGDDIFVTNSALLKRGIEEKAANSILIKVNQIGTLTETLECIQLAHSKGFSAILSHRSGETEDTTIADLAVATGAGQIKSGAPCRSERTSKYNRLIAIEVELGCQAIYKDSNKFSL